MTGRPRSADQRSGMNPFLLVNHHHHDCDDYEGNDHEEDDDLSYQYDFEEKISPPADHQCGPLPACPEPRPNLPLITGDCHYGDPCALQLPVQ